MEKPLRVHQIILPPYAERGQRRILREKRKNVLSVPFMDMEFGYWYRVGQQQRGIYSRPYTYVVITLESSLLLVAFLFLALILRAINISPDAPISMFIAQRNYFLKINNSIPAQRLVRSMDEHFYKQYRYLMKGTIPISLFLMALCIAGIMILTGPENRVKRGTLCFLHLLMLITIMAFAIPSLLQSQFRVEKFTSTHLTMQEDFLNAWLVIASYEQNMMSYPKETHFISLFEKKYGCCGVNRSIKFRKNFAKHLMMPLIYSENFNQDSIQNYVNRRWEACLDRKKMKPKAKKEIKEIVKCNILMPRMENGLCLIHICYEYVIIISTLLCILLAFSNLCKWCLECANEEHHVDDIRRGKALRTRIQHIRKSNKLEAQYPNSSNCKTGIERTHLTEQTQNAQYVRSKLAQKMAKRFII